MSKKKIILIFSFAVLTLSVLGILFFLRNQKAEPLVSPVSEMSPSVETKETGVLFYEDEAGFSFQYPQTLGIVEMDLNNPNTYSSLELLSKDHFQEKMVVRIVDTDLSSVDAWIKANSQKGDLVSEKEIDLSGIKGKFFKYSNPSRNLVLAIDSGILYYFEAPGSDFWQNAFEIVVSSFKLAENKDSTVENNSPMVIEEEEEIIE